MANLLLLIEFTCRVRAALDSQLREGR